VSPEVVIDGNATEPALAVITPLTVTLEGVIAPKVTVIAGVVVALATDPEIPFALTIDNVVTVPLPPPPPPTCVATSEKFPT